MCAQLILTTPYYTTSIKIMYLVNENNVVLYEINVKMMNIIAIYVMISSI